MLLSPTRRGDAPPAFPEKLWRKRDRSQTRKNAIIASDDGVLT
jgi:hypothetical protein